MVESARLNPRIVKTDRGQAIPHVIREAITDRSQVLRIANGDEFSLLVSHVAGVPCSREKAHIGREECRYLTCYSAANGAARQCKDIQTRHRLSLQQGDSQAAISNTASALRSEAPAARCRADG